MSEDEPLVTKRAFDEQTAATKRDIDELRRDVKTGFDRLSVEIERSGMHVANVMIEHIQKLISVVDEKYQDLPRDHGNLRSDFEAHAGDTRLHVSPPVTPTKRARRSPR